MEYLIIAGQFVLSLSILVILHELGHFIPAKLFGCRVEKFYLFFDPWFSLFKKKKGETEYGVGWLPLGGYVKISGMVDESLDMEQMKQPAQPWEFRSKPAWQRLIIMVGGVTVNILLAIFIYWMLAFFVGKDYLPNEKAVNGYYFSPMAQKVGFADGDKIVSIDGKPLDRAGKLAKSIILSDNESVKVVVNRGGTEKEILITKEAKGDLIRSKSPIGAPRFPFEVEKVDEKSPNFGGPLKKGDRFLSVEGEPTPFANDVIRHISGYHTMGNSIVGRILPKDFQAKYGDKMVAVKLLRGNDTLNVDLKLDDKLSMGILLMSDTAFLDYTHESFTFLQSFSEGMKDAKNTLVNYVSQFSLMFNGTVKATESLGGFASIASLFSSTWNWAAFWSLTAFLSVMLAFMNLLPIPALDGGHVMFLLWEMVTGRKPSDKFMEWAQTVGIVLLISLMLFANGMDIIRKFF